MRNTFCEISLGAIKNNLNMIKKTVGDNVKICGVVKANAYGHGLVPVAQALATAGADYLAVALAEEGKILRENNINIPILVMAGVDQEDIETCIDFDVTITASSIEKLHAIVDIGMRKKKIPIVHLKIDTGMGRIGVHWNRAKEFLRLAKKLSDENKILCEGIYTHFSDSLDAEFTKMQFERFESVRALASALGLGIKISHACSSRSIFMYPEFHLNMVRPGIALYGIEPELDKKILPNGMKRALQWKTKVVYFKVVSADESVGYGKLWKPKGRFARIVTIPVGYADGFARRFSNCGRVIIHGKIFPIVGRVCMDAAMVSLGEQGTAYNGDVVTLIGDQDGAAITVEMLADLIGAAPHEITTMISNRVPRLYPKHLL